MLFIYYYFYESIIHPANYSFVVHSLYQLSTFLSNLAAGPVKNEAVARNADIVRKDLLTVIFSYPK